jgi:hypothetical protein
MSRCLGPVDLEHVIGGAGPGDFITRFLNGFRGYRATTLENGLGTPWIEALRGGWRASVRPDTPNGRGANFLGRYLANHGSLPGQPLQK